MKVSYLQYIDDTIFICPFKMVNINAIKYILRNFELLSGLNVNFNKSSLWGLNSNQQLTEEGAHALGSEIGVGFLSYLGLNVGINHKKLESWADLVNKI